MSKSIIIIGAGIGGLSSGCFSQMNGYNSQIFEMHDKPGGLCTSWERRGYTFDFGLEWLVGSSPESGYYHLWEEVGALHNQQVINMEQFHRVESREGQVFTLYSDIERLEHHMKEIAPEDSAFITEFAGTVRRFKEFNLPADKAMELLNLADNLKLFSQVRPFMGDLRKWGKITMRDFALKFKNSLLREVWQMIWPPEFSSLFMVMTLSWLAQKNAGYIIGGSMALSRSMEKRYLELGGKIHYMAKVNKILVENNQAVGIKLENGSEYKADIVISAADGHAAIYDMLEGKFTDDVIRGYYEKMPVFKPLVCVGLGVNRSFDDFPKIISGLVFPIDKPIIIGDKEHTSLIARIHNFDPTLAPTGKTVITTIFETDYAYWESLYKDLVQYKEVKENIAEAVVAALDKRFPGLAGQVETRDVSTPMTFYRYTGNWQGSYEGWLLTPQNLTLQMKKTLPGLRNFYMVGQWVQPGGGLPSGLMTGCHVTQILCKADKKKYCAVCP